MKLLDQWGTDLVGASHGCSAPEQCDLVLRGWLADRGWVMTSAVVRVDGRNVYTQSGSHYVLGDRHPKFVAWMEEQGLPFDPENPIRKKKYANDS